MLSAVTEAVDVLSHPKPIKKKVRPLQSKWNVAQKEKQKPRRLADVVEELRSNVVDAAQKLQQQQSDVA